MGVCLMIYVYACVGSAIVEGVCMHTSPSYVPTPQPINPTQPYEPTQNPTTGKKAQSVGAQLRRHGEQQTKEDVRAILAEWAELLGACDLVFLSVPKAMRCVFGLGGVDGCVRCMSYSYRWSTSTPLAHLSIHLPPLTPTPTLKPNPTAIPSQRHPIHPSR